MEVIEINVLALNDVNMILLTLELFTLQLVWCEILGCISD